MSDHITIRVPAYLHHHTATTHTITRALEDFLQHFAMLGYAPDAWGDLCDDDGSLFLHMVRIPARQQALEVCGVFISAHDIAP